MPAPRGDRSFTRDAPEARTGGTEMPHGTRRLRTQEAAVPIEGLLPDHSSWSHVAFW